MLTLAEPHIFSIESYVAGRSIENDPKISSWAKLGSNENCLGPSKNAMEMAMRSLLTAHLYPVAKRLLVVDKICEHLKEFSVKPNQVALGNGSSELLANLVRGLVAPHEAVLFGWPSFVMYRLAAQVHGRRYRAVPVKADMSYDLEAMIKQTMANDGAPVKLMIVANPNNPSGLYLSKDIFNDFLAMVPKDVVLVIDEAYFEYVMKDDYPNGLAHAMTRPRTVVLRTFSKIYGLAGLRLGYAVGDPDVINILCRVRDPFNVNSVVQAAAMAALEDYEHVATSIQHNLLMKPKLALGLRDLGFQIHDGVGNFLLAKRSETMPSIKDLCNSLLPLGVILRPLDTYGIDDFVRISVGTQNEITQLFQALSVVLAKS